MGCDCELIKHGNRVQPFTGRGGQSIEQKKDCCLGPTVDMRAGGHLSGVDPVQDGGGGGSRPTTSFSEADWR